MNPIQFGQVKGQYEMPIDTARHRLEKVAEQVAKETGDTLHIELSENDVLDIKGGDQGTEVTEAKEPSKSFVVKTKSGSPKTEGMLAFFLRLGGFQIA